MRPVKPQSTHMDAHFEPIHAALEGPCGKELCMRTRNAPVDVQVRP